VEISGALWFDSLPHKNAMAFFIHVWRKEKMYRIKYYITKTEKIELKHTNR